MTNNTEQDPVAWVEVERGIPMFAGFADKYKPTGDGFIPLYAAHVRTKDLTASEIRDIWNSSDNYDVFCVEFARAVIAADREKNK